jgi:DNA-directed RNA polymerase sigma subunit (sigma70/sigma32)
MVKANLRFVISAATTSYNLSDLVDLPSVHLNHRRPSAHHLHLGTHDRDHQIHHVQVGQMLNEIGREPTAEELAQKFATGHNF